MQQIFSIARITLLGVVRDKVLSALCGVALISLFLVPAISLFSMRQVRELSITLSLSISSVMLIVLAVLLGATSLWRDIEKRYTASVLGLPVSRSNFLFGRFLGLALFLMLCSFVLALSGCGVIAWHATDISSGRVLDWTNIVLAFGGDLLKALLLVALALLFSTVSTSIFLPVFGTLGVYIAGSASQEVMDYVTSPAGAELSAVSRGVAQLFYYVVPNFELFNFKVAAVYGLPLSLLGVGYALGYFLIYTAILLCVSTLIFSRRELP